MLVMSQLPIQTTKILYSFFVVHLCPPTLKKVPPPMTMRTVKIQVVTVKIQVAFYKHLVPYSTSEVMALMWQMFRLLANLPNFSSCFNKFIEGGEPTASVNI